MFTHAPREAMPEALLKGLASGGKVVEDAIRVQLAPHNKTDELLNDLDTTITLDAEFRGGVAMSGFSRDQGRVANWLEFGHREVGHKPDKKEEGMAAPEPFMRPAAELSAGAAVDAFDDAAMDELAKAGVVDA